MISLDQRFHQKNTYRLCACAPFAHIAPLPHGLAQSSRVLKESNSNNVGYPQGGSGERGETGGDGNKGDRGPGGVPGVDGIPGPRVSSKNLLCH